MWLDPTGKHEVWGDQVRSFGKGISSSRSLRETMTGLPDWNQTRGEKDAFRGKRSERGNAGDIFFDDLTALSISMQRRIIVFS